VSAALYLVATPIGNLGDLSERARAVLGAVDLVASEDTRRTGLLLRRLGIRKPQVSFHAFNERRRLAGLLELLERGRDVALVSDAGTPGISDPGYSLVRGAIARGIPVTMVPGPSALVVAVVLSGLPSHSFTFRGFPPRSAAARRRFLAVDRDAPHTLVYYEAPHRLAAFLADARAVLGDREAAVCLELTKRFERIERGRLSALEAAFAARPPRGEVTVVVAGAARRRVGRVLRGRICLARARRVSLVRDGGRRRAKVAAEPGC
jgi:16S rRNA (cytidine1402-2'-O)-methyltransferase